MFQCTSRGPFTIMTCKCHASYSVGPTGNLWIRKDEISTPHWIHIYILDICTRSAPTFKMQRIKLSKSETPRIYGVSTIGILYCPYELYYVIYMYVYIRYMRKKYTSVYCWVKNIDVCIWVGNLYVCICEWGWGTKEKRSLIYYEKEINVRMEIW